MSDEFIREQLIQNLPQQGQVEWIGIRPQKRKPLKTLDKVLVLKKGLKGISINSLCPLRDLKHVDARREPQQNGYSIRQVHNAADACFRSRPTGLYTRLRLSVALS